MQATAHTLNRFLHCSGHDGASANMALSSAVRQVVKLACKRGVTGSQPRSESGRHSLVLRAEQGNEPLVCNRGVCGCMQVNTRTHVSLLEKFRTPLCEYHLDRNRDACEEGRHAQPEWARAGVGWRRSSLSADERPGRGQLKAQVGLAISIFGLKLKSACPPCNETCNTDLLLDLEDPRWDRSTMFPGSRPAGCHCCRCTGRHPTRIRLGTGSPGQGHRCPGSVQGSCRSGESKERGKAVV